MGLTEGFVAAIVLVIMGFGGWRDFKNGYSGAWQPSRWDLMISMVLSAFAYLVCWLVILRRIPNAQQNWLVDVSMALIYATLLNNFRLTTWQFGKSAKRST